MNKKLTINMHLSHTNFLLISDNRNKQNEIIIKYSLIFLTCIGLVVKSLGVFF